MAYVRNTSGSYGLYEKYRDPETGRQKERCLCRFGCYPDAWSAYRGYRNEIAMAWWVYRKTRYQHSDWARHERVWATGVVDRLTTKLAGVVEYLGSRGEKVRWTTWTFGEHWHPVAIRKLVPEEQPQDA